MADLEDVYASRIVLEVLALRLTMTNLQEGDLDKLEQHCDSMESHEGDFDTWEAPHVAFHECLAMGAGPQMRKVLANLADHAVRYRRFSLSVPRGWARGAQEHRAILSAVRSNARQDAGTQLAQHFARTALSVIAVLDPGHDPKQVREALALVADSSEHSR
jgi:DNA-binding GntR family transcriptional regulator